MDKQYLTSHNRCSYSGVRIGVGVGMGIGVMGGGGSENCVLAPPRNVHLETLQFLLLAISVRPTKRIIISAGGLFWLASGLLRWIL